MSFHEQPDASSSEFPFAFAHICHWDNPGWFPLHPLYSLECWGSCQCHDSSGKHEFLQTHTHTPLPPLPSYTTHRSCSNLDAEQMKFVWAPLTTNPFVKVCTSHHNPSLCTSDQQSDFVLVFIFRLILHCSSQRGFNREERKHQEQICCCQLVGNGFRFHRQAY